MAARAPFKATDALALVERVLRGGHNVFFDLLEQAADNVVEAAELLDELLGRFPEHDGLTAAIVRCERRGDDISHELIARINRELSTPIEHEDLLALTSALDDVVDLVDEVAAYLDLYHVDAPTPEARALAGVLLRSARELAAAVHISTTLGDISAHVVEVHRLENEGDRLVRDAIASLFEEGVDPMAVIRWKDIFERLEDAIDSTERAASVLEGVLIKNS